MDPAAKPDNWMPFPVFDQKTKVANDRKLGSAHVPHQWMENAAPSMDVT